MIRPIVPWKATAPDCVTVLHATEHRWDNIDGRLVHRPLRLTKLITEDAIKGYDRATLFHPSAWQLDGVEDFFELLPILEPQPTACIVRGALKPEAADRAEVLRRYAAHHGDLAAFGPAARQWLMVDGDDLPCPLGVDPADPLLAGGAVRRILPAEFRSACCVVQLSSGAGLKPVLKVHLWFWLDRPITDAEAKRWLKGAPVDDSIYQPVGIHYVARPQFVGIDDPCHERLAVLPGYAEVAVPDLPDPDRPRATFNPSLAGCGTFGGAGAERYADACLRRLALAPVGRRHNTCLAVSCCLFEHAHAGRLDPVRVIARIKGVMTGKGMDLSEVNSILEWAWQRTRPERWSDG